MADYVTNEQLAAFAHEFKALADSDAVDTLITAASRLFDNLCEVDEDFFAPGDAEEDPDFTERDFVGDGTAYLKLDPYIALDDDPISINEGTILDDDFDVVNVPEYVERSGMLVVLGKTTYQRFTPSGMNRFVGWPDGKQIRVSANWGFSAIPADVQMATVHLALHLWRTADPAFAQISNADNTVSVRTVPRVAEVVIEKYREKYSRRALFA